MEADIKSLNSTNGNNSAVFWDADCMSSTAHMLFEHYVPTHANTCFLNNLLNINFIKAYKTAYPNNKIVFYNMEHKYPLEENKYPKNCNEYWSQYFNDVMGMIDEIWDFNIENYIYANNHGFEHKFKFIPLRYTTWFEQFVIKDKKPRYELQFEGVFDSNFRLLTMVVLTKMMCGISTGRNSLILKISNTKDNKLKFEEKQDAKWCLDLPHYDTPETINAFRIWEGICVNQPALVLDVYNIGSRKYFGDLCEYINFEQFNTKNLIHIMDTVEPPKDVAGRFKEMTYTDEAYNKYRRDIIEDFRKISGEDIPDNVL